MSVCLGAARIIESFLDTLTVENRVIFMRRYWFSDSYREIAEFVGLTEKNISVRLSRIRQKMKEYDGVYYELSTHSNDPDRIYELIATTTGALRTGPFPKFMEEPSYEVQ